jgi:hypothetical protein
MGAEPYSYTVPYQPDIAKALQDLRKEVFKSGNYRGSEHKPKTIKEAIDNMVADGTASILDIERLSNVIDLGAAAPLEADVVLEMFGTGKPTIELIKEHEHDLYGWVGRGQCIYLISFKDNKPDQIYFAGYSFD